MLEPMGVKGQVFRDFEVFERYWKVNLSTGLPPFRCPNLGVPILVCWAGYVGFKLGGYEQPGSKRK